MTDKIFICACCYGEFVDELTDAEKHEEFFESFGEELEDLGEVSQVCGECYCELIGKIPVNHTYAEVLH
jgi:hypothetical protein